jgi:hypothetical protein
MYRNAVAAEEEILQDQKHLDTSSASTAEPPDEAGDLTRLYIA